MLLNVAHHQSVESQPIRSNKTDENKRRRPTGSARMSVIYEFVKRAEHRVGVNKEQRGTDKFVSDQMNRGRNDLLHLLALRPSPAS